MDTWVIVLIVLFVCLVVFEILFAAILFCLVFKRRKSHNFDAESEKFMLFEPLYKEEKAYVENLEKREVSVTARDGVVLKGDFYSAPNARATLIFFHGYRGSAAYFCFCLRFFHSRGFNILLPDQRAHGRSGGKYTCFGIKERFDCLDWINLATTQLAVGLPVVLDGISMGATTVLLATELDLDEQVKAVIADCGFSSAWEQGKYTLRHVMHLPVFPTMNLIDLFVRMFAKCKLRACNTLDAMRKNQTIPIFFATGTNDRVVPRHMTEQNYQACNAPKILLLTEASHGLSFLAAKNEYEKQLESFLNGCLASID